MNIKNRAEVLAQLVEILKDFDKCMNEYQTDVYAYYNDATETVELDTFVNVGGNSWLNDDHITIYTDTEYDHDMTYRCMDKSSDEYKSYCAEIDADCNGWYIEKAEQIISEKLENKS